MLASSTPPRVKALRMAVKFCILAVFILGNILNLQVGWADNGDFARIAQWFSSRPVEYETWPDAGTQVWNERFFHYFVPEWKLDFPGTSHMFNSALLLWLPGVLINRFFYSTYTLYLPILSLGARLALLLFLWLTFHWIDRRSRRPLLFYFTLILPLTLLFTTTDVVAFFNSFYQETGSIVFVPFLLAVLVFARFKPRNWFFYLLYLASITLVTTSKTASFYWAFISIPFVISLSQYRRKPLLYIPLAISLIAVPLFAGLTFTHVPTIGPSREYNSLFNGTLILSTDPQKRLTELGMPDGIRCVGVDFYAQGGHECLAQVAAKTSYFAVLQTMLAEPQIIIRQINLIDSNLHNYSLDLGKTIRGDQTVRQEFRLNFWSEIKKQYFPHGWPLIAVLFMAGILFLFGLRRTDLAGDLAIIGLVCLAAFFIDLFAEIVGDGPRDLLKHLFMPSMFFDFLAIAAVNIGGFFAFEGLSARLSRILQRHPEQTK